MTIKARETALRYANRHAADPKKKEYICALIFAPESTWNRIPAYGLSAKVTEEIKARLRKIAAENE